MKAYNYYKNELDKLKEKCLFRSIKSINNKTDKYIETSEGKFLNLSSNNYLSLASNEDLQKEFFAYALNNKEARFGSASARLLTGSSSIYEKLEHQVATLYNKESCLIFNSGYHANVGIVSSLVKKGDVIYSDKLNHASIIDGMKLSGADFYRYKHLDYDNLEAQLIKNRDKYKNAIIISESVFSMDGDIADLKSLIRLKEKYNAILMVDEAHAFGIFGDNGCGISEDHKDKIDLIVGAFGKAIGSVGAYVSGDRVLIDYLINKARSFIFSTSLPPINIMWTDWILEQKLPFLTKEKEHLLDTAAKLRQELKENDIDTAGKSQIVPAIIGDNNKTVYIAEKLKQEGYWVLPVRPPTVPVGSSRLRFSLSSDIEWEEIKEIPRLIKGYLNES